MGVLGVITCEILELEFAHLLAGDPDVAKITILEDARSTRIGEALDSAAGKNPARIRVLGAFAPDSGRKLEVLIRVLELALHNRKRILQEGLRDAVLEMSPYVDALVLGYGLCGNALEKPEELLSDAGVPVFIPMDGDHPVDDCVGLIIGGRESYYGEQCKVAGTFFMIPGWTYHWRRMFQQDFGSMDVAMAKRLFARYERSLIIPTPIMSEEKMRENIEEFNQMFGFRTEIREGTLGILEKTWKTAKTHVV